jgi:hypothetical protein
MCLNFTNDHFGVGLLPLMPSKFVTFVVVLQTLKKCEHDVIDINTGFNMASFNLHGK